MELPCLPVQLTTLSPVLSAYTRWAGAPSVGDFALAEPRCPPGAAQDDEPDTRSGLEHAGGGCPRDILSDRGTRVFVAVMSAPANAHLRQGIRETWCVAARRATAAAARNVSFAVAFVVGTRPDGSYAPELLEEAAAFGDLALVPVVDNVGNVTNKLVRSMSDAARDPATTHFFRADDDSWVNIDRVAEELSAATVDAVPRSAVVPRRADPHAPWCWGRFTEAYPELGLEFPAGFGFLLSAPLLKAVVAGAGHHGERVSSHARHDQGGALRPPLKSAGGFVRGTRIWVADDLFVGVLLWPLRHERIHDMRIHDWPTRHLNGQLASERSVVVHKVRSREEFAMLEAGDYAAINAAAVAAAAAAAGGGTTVVVDGVAHTLAAAPTVEECAQLGLGAEDCALLARSMGGRKPRRRRIRASRAPHYFCL